MFRQRIDKTHNSQGSVTATVDVIVPILPLLISKTRKILLLSGILAEQEPMIRDALGKEGISNCEIEYSGEWISALITR